MRRTKTKNKQLTVEVQVINTAKLFAWRMVIREQGKARVLASSHWTKHYEGILSVSYGHRTFICVTPYFEGVLPAWIPLAVNVSKTDPGFEQKTSTVDENLYEEPKVHAKD